MEGRCDACRGKQGNIQKGGMNKESVKDTFSRSRKGFCALIFEGFWGVGLGMIDRWTDGHHWSTEAPAIFDGRIDWGAVGHPSILTAPCRNPSHGECASRW